MRAIWKGHIRFSLVTIPVRIYSAIDNAQTLSFNQLSKETHNPVGYDKKDKVTGEVLKSSDIVKGYQYSPGQFVLIEPEDFEKVKLQSTKVIEIEGFVDEADVHPTLFDSPYYAGPDGEIAVKTYGLLCQALKASGKLGVGRVVLRDRETVVLLAPKEKGLVMYKLRYPQEIRPMNEVPLVGGKVESDEAQLKLATTLIESLTKKFSDFELKDRYTDALKDMIEAKIEGKEVIAVAEQEPEVIDIMTALKASIAQAKSEKKPMKKATGPRKAATKTADKKKTA